MFKRKKKRERPAFSATEALSAEAGSQAGDAGTPELDSGDLNLEVKRPKVARPVASFVFQSSLAGETKHAASSGDDDGEAIRGQAATSSTQEAKDRATAPNLLEAPSEPGGGGGSSGSSGGGEQSFKTAPKRTAKAAATGPLRAPANLRVTSRFDYQQDICKDYKETGFCGFGDNCIYLHDRGNYKTGWELEREWEERQRERAAALGKGEKREAASDGADPQDQSESNNTCPICKLPFTAPVVKTLCDHRFCQRCAFAHHAKNRRCAVCGAQTRGVFNTVVK